MELYRLFKTLDIKSFVPNADDEKYFLDQLETPNFDITDDDEDFDLWYISPKLLESLVGGAGLRRTLPGEKKPTKNSNKKS